MTDNPRLSFADAIAKVITRDMMSDPEWALTIAARTDATDALRMARIKEGGRMR